MAEAIALKEVPVSDMSRVFNRVDAVSVSPIDLYESYGVKEENRATFKLKPADPATRDEMKQIVQSFTLLQSKIADAYDIDVSAMGGNIKKPRKGAKKEELIAHEKIVEHIALAFHSFKHACDAAMSDEDARKLIAKCVVEVDNYKELDNGELVDSSKTAQQIIQDIPAVFCVWLFEQIQRLSNLTTEEVLGL